MKPKPKTIIADKEFFEKVFQKLDNPLGYKPIAVPNFFKHLEQYDYLIHTKLGTCVYSRLRNVFFKHSVYSWTREKYFDGYELSIKFKEKEKETEPIEITDDFV